MATRLLFVGGFLGAGKTTLLLQAAHSLAARGLRVGIVTNDQASDLVDTARVRSANIAVQEVAGGCFCCRFPDLLAAIERLHERVNPDVVLGEPVGSCTDLISTIFRPLHASTPTRFQVAPLTVLIDPQRDLASLPAEVGYIYEKQLTEANIIALSKSDLYDEASVAQSVREIKDRYPLTPVITLSAKTGAGLPGWLETCIHQSSTLEGVLELDYAMYARGEAQLGWLNASGRVTAHSHFSVAQWAQHLLGAIEQACTARQAMIAHVKLYLTTPRGGHMVSLTHPGRPVSWDHLADDEQTSQATFLLNARVGTDPSTLEALVRQSLAHAETQANLHTDITTLACFSPLPPRPTYRLLQI